MGAKEDLAEFNALLDRLGERCTNDDAYKAEMMGDAMHELADVGVGAVYLAEVLAYQGADDAEVSGHGMSFDPMEGGSVVWRGKKTKTSCITGSGKKGRSCGGRTLVINETKNTMKLLETDMP